VGAISADQKAAPLKLLTVPALAFEVKTYFRRSKGGSVEAPRSSEARRPAHCYFRRSKGGSVEAIESVLITVHNLGLFPPIKRRLR